MKITDAVFVTAFATSPFSTFFQSILKKFNRYFLHIDFKAVLKCHVEGVKGRETLYEKVEGCILPQSIKNEVIFYLKIFDIFFGRKN